MKISKLLITIIILTTFLIESTEVIYTLAPISANVTCFREHTTSLPHDAQHIARVPVPKTADELKGLHQRPTFALADTCNKIYLAFSGKIKIRISRGAQDTDKESIYPAEQGTLIITELDIFMKSISNLGPDKYTGPYTIIIEGPFNEKLLEYAALILGTVIQDSRFINGFDASPLNLRRLINARIEQLSQYIKSPELMKRINTENIGKGTPRDFGSRIVELKLHDFDGKEIMIAVEEGLDRSVWPGYIDSEGNFFRDDKITDLVVVILGVTENGIRNEIDQLYPWPQIPSTALPCSPTNFTKPTDVDSGL